MTSSGLMKQVWLTAQRYLAGQVLEPHFGDVSDRSQGLPVWPLPLVNRLVHDRIPQLLCSPGAVRCVLGETKTEEQGQRIPMALTCRLISCLRKRDCFFSFPRQHNWPSPGAGPTLWAQQLGWHFCGSWLSTWPVQGFIPRLGQNRQSLPLSNPTRGGGANGFGLSYFATCCNTGIGVRNKDAPRHRWGVSSLWCSRYGRSTWGSSSHAHTERAERA